MLEHYIQKCDELFRIAYFQWRLKFPSKLTKENEVIELKKAQINNLWGKSFL